LEDLCYVDLPEFRFGNLLLIPNTWVISSYQFPGSRAISAERDAGNLQVASDEKHFKGRVFFFDVFFNLKRKAEK
jgi:hypothetical protein